MDTLGKQYFRFFSISNIVQVYCLQRLENLEVVALVRFRRNVHDHEFLHQIGVGKGKLPGCLAASSGR